MKGISLKAVALATLAVFGIDFVSSLMLASAFQLPVNGSEQELRSALEALNHNPRYLNSALILGTASTVIGGFLTARLAGTLPYFNALAFGIVGVLIGIPMTTGIPTSVRIVGLGLTIPAALLGAFLSKRTGPQARAS